MTENTFTIQNYHARTKHQLDKYAPGPETLDWDNQPDPFRTFHGSPVLKLPLVASKDMTPYYLLGKPGKVVSQNLNITAIGKLMELSMALSAWKSYGPDRWSLRVNPSSGNLHPTECYLVLPSCPRIPAGIYHYNSYEHWLEQRCDMLNKSIQLNKLMGAGQFIVGLTSIHKRESWKYGERGYRYCQHDIGHAIAAIRYACAVLGWEVSLLGEPSDSQVATLLGINHDDDFIRVERESPDLLLRISTKVTAVSSIDIDKIIELSSDCYWSGKANRLTNDNFYKWPVIRQAEVACVKPETPAMDWTPELDNELPACSEAHTATDIIRQRRSAQAFNGNAPTLELEYFDRMLQSLLPRQSVPPLDSLPWAPRVHLILFVHKVDGIKPGLYALPRSQEGKVVLQNELRNEFLWEPVEMLTSPLYKLVSANAANSARKLACHQPIASESAFSLAMLAEFDNSLEQTPWQYRQLFWEAGVIGQSLYLEAEVAGVRGTGIGCFFDDAVHELLGINTTVLQDIYHFTVGQPRLDNRLQSDPPYKHLTTNQSL